MTPSLLCYFSVENDLSQTQTRPFSTFPSNSPIYLYAVVHRFRRAEAGRRGRRHIRSDRTKRFYAPDHSGGSQREYRQAWSAVCRFSHPSPSRSAFVLFSSVLRVSSSQNQTRAFHSEPRRRRRLSAARVLILLGMRASEITPQGGSPSPPAQIQRPRETIKFPSCFFSNSGAGRRGIPIPGGDDGGFPVEHGES